MKKRTLALMLSAALCVGMLAGCGGGATGTVNTNGSTSMEEVMGSLIESYKSVDSGVTVNYSGTGSGAGIEGVLAGVTIREQTDGRFKASVRTHPPLDAAAICARLGGGGHPRAAGCEISGNLDNAKHAILDEVKKELDRAAQAAEPDA